MFFCSCIDKIIAERKDLGNDHFLVSNLVISLFKVRNPRNILSFLHFIEIIERRRLPVEFEYSSRFTCKCSGSR